MDMRGFVFVFADESQSGDSCAGGQKKTAAWAPCFYSKGGKEVYHYVGQEIVIEEGFDSFAGMIWPAVSGTTPNLLQPATLKK